MASALKSVVILLAILSFWAAYKVAKMFTPPPLPKLDQNAYWGPGKPKPDDPTIKPFKISVPDAILEDLNRRLDNTKVAKPLEGINFEYGFNSDTLQKVVHFWRNEYKWRERETYLNSFPQYKTQIQGLDIHYIHIKNTAKGVRSVPLLIMHGWPGSIREFTSLLPLITKPNPKADFVFEIIAPSLPGYGFSQASSRPGLGAAEIAVIFKNLMKRLGHDRFYIQGGDWGSFIANILATVYPENIIGHHSNFCGMLTKQSYVKLFLGSYFPSFVVSKEHQDKVYPIGNLISFTIEESGYFHLQATKPDTIGVALSDSPAGLAAYILEKFSTWTNPKWKSSPDGGLTNKYNYTDLLDNVMIYWVTNSITTSMRLYAESFSIRHMSMQLESIPTMTPTACLKFSNEIMYIPDSLIRDKYHRLVQVTDIDDGGHFGAFELPQIFADDLWKAIIYMEENKNGEKRKF